MNPPDEPAGGVILGQDWVKARARASDLAENDQGELRQNLQGYRPTGYHPGRGAIVRLLWYFVSLLLFESGLLPWGRPKVWLLRAFGARIGASVSIKPHVRIKHPWRLSIGDYSWIGQQTWIDNLVMVEIGSHTCVSQGVYLCTGSHDHKKTSFDLVTEPIKIGDACWIGCFAVLLGGCRVPNNTVVVAKTLVTPRMLENLNAPSA